MKIYTKYKEIDRWILKMETIIKNHPNSSENAKTLIAKLKQQRTDLANEIGQNISKNRSKFFKNN